MVWPKFLVLSVPQSDSPSHFYWYYELIVIELISVFVSFFKLPRINSSAYCNNFICFYNTFMVWHWYCWISDSKAWKHRKLRKRYEVIEYTITTFGNFTLTSTQSALLPYFIFGGLLSMLMGYWAKKMMGALFALFIVLFAFLYTTGVFNRIMG